MKNLTTAIVTKASGSAFLSAIGSRLYKGRAEQGAAYPYAVFFMVSNTPELTFSEDYENTIIQFSLFSTTSGTTEIEDIYTHLKALYDECALTITGATLVWMKRDHAVFLAEDHAITTSAGTTRVWVYHVDYSILTSLD